MARDERRMTFIVVPHGGGDLSTRSFEVSYRRLRVVAVVLGIAFLLWAGTVVSWWWVAAQAARVPGLQAEIAELQKDRLRVEQLARVIARMEAQYEQVRAMLGGSVELDSLREESAADTIATPLRGEPRGASAPPYANAD